LGGPSCKNFVPTPAPVLEQQARQHHAGEANAELLRRWAAGDYALCKFTELVVHTTAFVWVIVV